MRIQSLPLDQTRNKQSNNAGPKTIYFFLGFIIISFIVAFILGGYFIGKSKSEKQNQSKNISGQAGISLKQLPDNSDNWTAYEIKAVKMQIKLPEKLTKLGVWNEYEKKGDKGSIICFSLKISDGAYCDGEILVIGGSSKDFESGREWQFTDFQGFRKENDSYFIKTVFGDEFELKNAKFKEFESENGIEIIKILGENQTFEGNEIPIGGTPGKGFLGAIINTKSSKYPGLSIQLDLRSNVSEFEFDQILRSIKLIN